METLQTKELTPELEAVFVKNIKELVGWQFPNDERMILQTVVASRLRRYKKGYWNWKQCKRCSRFEGPVEFGPHARAKDGKQPICKGCRVEMGKRIYKEQHDLGNG